MNRAIATSTRLRRAESHQWRETKDGRILIFPRYKDRRPDFHGFFELGSFEALVWRELEHQPTASQLRDSLLQAIRNSGEVEEPTGEELWNELVTYLQEMAENGLIQLDSETAA